MLSKKLLNEVFTELTGKKALEVTVSDMMELLVCVNKQLYLKMLARKYTFDQFKTRIFEILQKLP